MTLQADPVFIEVPIPMGTLVLSKHLAGKHDQSSHAGGRGGGDTAPTGKLKPKASAFNKLPVSIFNRINSDLRHYVGTSNGTNLNYRLHSGSGLEIGPRPYYVKEQGEWERMEKKEISQIKGVTSIIERSPALGEDLEFVRHSYGTELGEIYKGEPEGLQSLVGQVVENKGFTSVSTVFAKEGDTEPFKHPFSQEDVDSEIGMAGKDRVRPAYPVTFKIVAPKGTKGVRGMKDENEFVLQRGTKFMITKVDYKSGGITTTTPSPFGEGYAPRVERTPIIAEIEMTIVSQDVS